MRRDARRRIIPSVSSAAIFALIGLISVQDGVGQDDGTRPIEFSEPRNSKGQETNISGFKAESRRLTDLEERLSRTFNIFHQDESLGGAPMPRVVPHTPTPRTRARSAGSLDEEGNWAFSDPLQELLRSLNGEDGDLKGLAGDAKEDSGKSQTDLLNQLRADDWLVKGTLGEDFWDVPINADTAQGEGPDEAQTGRNGWGQPSYELTSWAERESGGDERRRETQQGSSWSTAESWGAVPTLNDLTFTRPAERPEPWSTSLKVAQDARREEFRQLLGFEPSQPSRETRAAGFDFSPVEPARTELPTESATRLPAAIPLQTVSPFSPLPQPGLVMADPRESLQPVSAGGLDSLFPAAPAAPGAPGLFNSTQAPATGQAQSPYSRLFSRPDYQAPARGF